MSFGEGNLRTAVAELQTENKALRQLVRDLYSYLESDYTPSYYEPLKERMRALGIEVDR